MLWTDDRLPMPSLWHAVFAVLLLSVGAVARADSMRFVPPDPTAHTAIDAIVSGRWSDSCVPIASDVSIAGSTITLHMVPSGMICAAAVTAYRSTVHLGVVRPGTYTVTAVVPRLARGESELAKQTLVVRDSDTLDISPYAIPTTGGRVQVAAKTATNITIDGVAATFKQFGSVVFVDAPPHAPGAVDVAVVQGTRTNVAKAALIYYDPNDADPVLFEPILFPIAFEGAGASGTQWITENSVWVGAMTFRDAIQTGLIRNDSQPWGKVLYARRNSASPSSLTLFASRYREVSRQPDNPGIEVPVVFERDFRDSRLWFTNAPVGTNLTATLNVWSLDAVSDITYSAGLTPIRVPTAKVPGTNLYFGSAAITQQTGNLVEVGSETSLPRIWAMITYTNSTTPHEVTIVTSHQQ